MNFDKTLSAFFILKKIMLHFYLNSFPFSIPQKREKKLRMFLFISSENKYIQILPNLIFFF